MTYEDFVALVNDPSVRPYVGWPGQRELSVAQTYYNPLNVIYGTREGACLAEYVRPGVYSGHFLYAQAVRGREVLRRTREYIKMLWFEHGAHMLYGIIPVENKASRTMARLLGFTPIGAWTDEAERHCVRYLLTGGCADEHAR